MGKDKKFVCICKDVTEEDIIYAIRRGFDDIERLKRFTGIQTGPCQGKTCLYHVLRILSQETGRPIHELGMPTPRPPLKPIPLRILAGEEDEE
ncbi:MAG: (2Fe-2S)-binding protein [Nitrososphaeria archaeon]|nr:(2Fe-2S)-binding protein [Nitrososphaeria archaeon]NIN53698.1 (2Fe-2S)-binding protein [Nitrososphaeria archaeon]NIQ34243.1 (2Fe-2S)-binding protein [Nitrososphaeria archaeon]